MKAILISCIGLLLLIACKNEIPKVYQNLNIERELAVNIEYIKSISEKRFTSFNMDDLTVKSMEATYVNVDSNWSVYSECYGLQAF
jgi:hypothetical protein